MTLNTGPTQEQVQQVTSELDQLSLQMLLGYELLFMQLQVEVGSWWSNICHRAATVHKAGSILTGRPPAGQGGGAMSNYAPWSIRAEHTRTPRALHNRP